MKDTIETECDKVDKRGAPLWAANKFVFGESEVVEREKVGDMLKKDFTPPGFERLEKPLTFQQKREISDALHDPTDPERMMEANEIILRGLTAQGQELPAWELMVDIGDINDDTLAEVYYYLFSDRHRKVILNSQGWDKERCWLRDATGLDLYHLENIVAVIDNQLIYGNLGDQLDQRPGLDKMMRTMQMTPTHVHNGGNDAAYTLAIAVIDAVWRSAWETWLADERKIMEDCFPGKTISGDEIVSAMRKVGDHDVKV